MMIKSFRLGAAGAALIAAVGFAGAANAAVSANADAEAVILESLTLAVQSGSQLNFGPVTANGAGTVTVTPAGAISCTSGFVCPGTGASAVGLDVTGNSGAVVDVTFPSATATLTNAGGNTLSLGSLTPSSAAVTLTGGSASFTVGGTISVGNGQQAGTYQGSFAVQVEYQ